MEKVIKLLENTLFENLNKEDMMKMYKCLKPIKRDFPRDSFVFHAGDKVGSIYFILSGSIHILDEDFWGNKSIIETMNVNTLFGEAYVLAKEERHLVSVVAAEDAVVLEIDPKKIFKACENNCSCHVKLIENAMAILSKKIVRLTGKLMHIVQRTMREKILSYLSQYSKQAQSNFFYIPYSRQQLADYLCVDRSALSHELSKLKREGLISYNKNYFELLEDVGK